jgi:hypothetical protein
MKILLAFLAAALVALTPAYAHTPFSGILFPGESAPAPPCLSTYTGPGDIVAFTAWGGARAYNRAVTCSGTRMLQVRKAATSEICDVLTALNGGPGLTAACTGASSGQTLAAWCGITSQACRVVKQYDQTGNTACGGNACDWVQATAGEQPYIAGTLTGSSMEIFFSSTPKSLKVVNNYTPSNAKMSMMVVAQRTSNALLGYPLKDVGSGNFIRFKNLAAHTWELVGGSAGTITATAGDSHYHSGIGVINGSSSVLNIDATETTGTVTGSTAAARPSIETGATISLKSRESGFVDNYALSPAERAALTLNASAYWGL